MRWSSRRRHLGKVPKAGAIATTEPAKCGAPSIDRFSFAVTGRFHLVTDRTCLVRQDVINLSRCPLTRHRH